MSLSPDDARRIVDKVLALSRAEETSVVLNGGRDANIRFARNEVTTSGDVTDSNLTVRCSFGARTGTAMVNQFDDATLERCARQAEEIARFAPEDPEHVPALGPQAYAAIAAHDEATASLAPERRAELAGKAIALARVKKVTVAGFATSSGGLTAIGNSKGLFGHHRQSRVTFSATARTADGTGSGWAGVNGERWSDLDAQGLAERAVDKAFRSAGARELAPGTYTVILEPSAVADLLVFFGFGMDARSADEGRSFFSKKGGGNRIGEKILSDKVTMSTDPADPRAPGAPFATDGLPTRKMAFIEDGVVRNLFYSRFWARKQEKEPTAQPQNALMKGAAGSVEDLVKDTKKGLLVTRLWYIRFVDPQTLLFTGLTRDGLFLVENGAVRSAVKNFRWNDSPVSIFSKIEAMSREVRARGSESEDFAVVCPAIRTRMAFTSLSDAV
ncbi:MAG: TldD/PmbA family protein [Acidobacteria bacterium]|nr:TldD/PmbA family protein [Acidobacteriota bacterium]